MRNFCFIKRLFTISLITGMSFSMFGIDLNLTLDLTNQEEHERVEQGNGGRREAPIPILCYIDENTGISFSSDLNLECITFEIQDKSGNIVGIFVDEFDFIEVLFSLQGEYKLVFTTPDYYLTGWITL